MALNIERERERETEREGNQEITKKKCQWKRAIGHFSLFLFFFSPSYMMMMIVGKYIKLKTPVQSTPPSTSVKLNWKYEPSHKKTLNTI